MTWDVKFTSKAAKQAQHLSERVLLVLQVLVENLKDRGPNPGEHWSHYGKLRGKKTEDKRHCHLKAGNPTYVCCWEVDKFDRKIEVYYVGTHEKAPY